MIILTLAGNTGKDAEHKVTQGGTDFCRFSVAGESGYGDNKQTIWVDVTKWGKGSEGLARTLRKGSRVAVTGEMSTREHDGKTYIQCRADHIKILGTPDGARKADEGQSEQSGGFRDDLDDDIPF
jgi:single-strand DNA-binding protein